MLSFSLTLDTVLSNSRMASSMVMENVTVMARMTMVTAIPKEIFRFISVPPRSDQQHQHHAPEDREQEHPCKQQTANAQKALAFFFVHNRQMASFISWGYNRGG